MNFVYLYLVSVGQISMRCQPSSVSSDMWNCEIRLFVFGVCGSSLACDGRTIQVLDMLNCCISSVCFVPGKGVAYQCVSSGGFVPSLFSCFVLPGVPIGASALF